MSTKAIWTVLALLSCSLITACGVPESVHPLSPADDAVPDPRLDGAWEGVHQDGTTDGSLHMYVRSDDSGLMDVVLVVLDDDFIETLTFEAHVTPSGDTRYLNVRPKFLLASEGENGEVDIDDSEWRIAKRYVFAKYSLSEDGLLHVWYLHESGALADAIRSKMLKGEESGGSWCGSDTLITDEPEWILKFLDERDHEEIFDGPAVFRKMHAPRDAS